MGTGDGSAAGEDGVDFGAGSVGLAARAGFLFGPIDSWDFGVSCAGCLVGSWWRLGPKVVVR